MDDTGHEQVRRLRERVGGRPLARVVTSPLERCVATAQSLADDVEVDERLLECDYGDWTGQALSELRKTRLWRVVQEHPAGAVFPGGESLRAMQSRAVEAVREHDAAVAASDGQRAVWAAVTHGDVIKAVVADALAMHLDQFQRLVVDPASVTAVSFTERRPFLLRLNDTGGELGELWPAKRRRRVSSDAVVGGGAG